MRMWLCAALLIPGLLLIACQQAETPKPAPAAVTQPPPPPPPPQPIETAFGKLVSAEKTDRYPVWVLNLTCRGGMCEEMERPSKGKTVYKLSFEGKKELPDEGRMSMSDAAQKKYRVAASRQEKSAAAFFFVVPEQGEGLSWSDGQSSFPLETLLKIKRPEAASSAAGGS